MLAKELNIENPIFDLKAPKTDKKSSTEKGTSSEPEANQEQEHKTQPNTVTDTGTRIDTYALLEDLVTPEEIMIRNVCYLNQEQSNFVKDMAKMLTKKNRGKKVTESEIFRTAIDYLIKATRGEGKK
jgi:hypothetical protein